VLSLWLIRNPPAIFSGKRPPVMAFCG